MLPAWSNFSKRAASRSEMRLPVSRWPQGVQKPAALGDVVLAREEFPASYHLAVSVDDTVQSVTLVTRGEDLTPSTRIHRMLQALLGFPAPCYRHHELLTDAVGRSLGRRRPCAGPPAAGDRRAAMRT